MTDAEELLRSYGISDPADIDLHAIAHLQGLSIRFAPLKACDARLVGIGNRGIITIRDDQSAERQRFSIGHEIGHWKHHRNKMLMCQSSDIGEEREAGKQREKVADLFASGLLMPRYLFRPLAQRSNRPSFELGMDLARRFRVSVTAALRRVVACDLFPTILVSYGIKGRRWYEKAPMVDDSWIPSFEIDGRSRALSTIIDRGKPTPAIKTPACIFFSRPDASAHDVTEQFWSPYEGEALGLFTFGRAART
jgi:Zn-dependent peptidase ImmA (M78 family)